MHRVPDHSSVLVDEMLALAPEALGLDDSTSAGERLEAWLAYARERFDEERRIRAYAELSELEAERVMAVRAAAVGAAEAGIL